MFHLQVTGNIPYMNTPTFVSGVYTAMFALKNDPSKGKEEPTKRPLPFTPTKVSPFAKKHSTLKSCSPRRKRKTIKRSLVYRPQNLALVNKYDSAFAEPIDENLVTKDPLVVLPNSSTSNLLSNNLSAIPEMYEDDHIVKGWDSSDDEPTTEVAEVPSDNEKGPHMESSQSLPDSKKTVTACSTPLEVTSTKALPGKPHQIQDDDENDLGGVELINWNSDSEETVTACVTPVRVKFSNTLFQAHCHDDHDYMGYKPNQLPGEIVNQPLTPIKIKINKVKKGQIDNISQYTNEYAIVARKEIAKLVTPEAQPVNPNNAELGQDLEAEPFHPNEPEVEPEPQPIIFGPILTEEDVPEAKLINPIVNKNSKSQLKYWLKWRGLKVGGSKQELVERVNACIAMQKEINRFLCDLSYKECHWSIMWNIEYEDFEFESDDLECFRQLRSKLYDALHEFIDRSKPSPNHTGPFEVKGTRGQSSNDLWNMLRSLHTSASTCRRVRLLKTDAGRTSHLRRCMWKMDTFTTRGMKYGIVSERKARDAYLKWRHETDSTVEVHEVGLYLNTNHTGLSCSPDGIVYSSSDSAKLLEIKCPYTLKTKSVKNFEKSLTEAQLSRFCLRREGAQIVLKQENLYYDQVQMCMGMLCLTECDFVVWSKVDFICVQVAFDEERWNDISRSLKKFHYQYQAPEYFMMRCPRNLPPVELP